MKSIIEREATFENNSDMDCCIKTFHSRLWSHTPRANALSVYYPQTSPEISIFNGYKSRGLYSSIHVM